MSYYTVDEGRALFWTGIVFGAIVASLIAYAVYAIVMAYRERQVERVYYDTRDARDHVVGITNAAQAEMARLLIEGRMRRGRER